MIPSQMPVLGILNDYDAPDERMVAVLWGKRADTLKWAYVSPKPGWMGEYQCGDASTFTPLNKFGVRAEMTRDGWLCIIRFGISCAVYKHDGAPRRWQGTDSSTIIRIKPGIAGYVVRAVALDFEARRGKPSAAAMTAQPQNQNANPS